MTQDGRFAGDHQSRIRQAPAPPLEKQLSKNLVIMGQGYVGLPLALRAVEVGIRVTGLEIAEQRVAHLNAGLSHVDDVSNDDLERGLAAGYQATTDPACLETADIIVVCVPTPLSDDGGPDLEAVEAAGRTIGRHVQPGALVVLESTTYPGTTEEIFAPLVLDDRYVAGQDILIAFSPERIDPGNQRYGVRNTPRVVGGITPRCTEAARNFYATFIDVVVVAKGAKEAEMAKLLENTFRHVNIALVNEMVRFCDELDIDLWDAIDCASTKPFGFMPFRPGPGVGGHCIPVDPSYLSHRVKAKLGYAFRMVELAEEINTAVPNYVASRAWSLLNDQSKSVRGSRVLLLGVTYKPDIADRRQSPADPLAARLMSWGADVRYHDHFVPSWRPLETATTLESEADLEAALADADLTILLQPHSQYVMERISKSARFLFDTRGVLEDASNVARL